MERSCQAAARATSRLSRLTHAALLVLVGGSSRVEFVAAQLQFMSLLVFLSFFLSSQFIYKGEINAATSLVNARALQESLPRGLTAFFFSSKSTGLVTVTLERLP
jgi:hypothetical protein